MAAQINKQQARDTVSVRQRQQVEARDAAARRQIERAAMSVDTRYSPSPSPRHALQPADVYRANRPCRLLHPSKYTESTSLYQQPRCVCVCLAGITAEAGVAATAPSGTDGVEAEVEAALPDALISMLPTLHGHRPAAYTSR